jgi:shikimate dehydrogenase
MMGVAPRACVIGWPITHSRSPLIHGYWLKHYGILGSYDKVAVRPDELESFLRSIGSDGLVGCNITAPHKEAAATLVAQLGGTLHGQATVGAINTVWLGGDGQLHATSTDAHGFTMHLLASVPDFILPGRTIMVLGAGGAAQSVVQGLAAAGAGEIRVTNRSAERAAALCRGYGNAVIVPWEDRERHLSDCDLLVNTTTLGMTGQSPLDMDLSGLPQHAVVYDIVYVPLETPLLAAARARGLRTVDGLGMLLHQAVPGFLTWFGKKPEVTPELRALVEADL